MVFLETGKTSARPKRKRVTPSRYGSPEGLGGLKQTVGREDTANGFRRGGSGRGRVRSPVREETNTRNGEHHPLSSNAAMEPTPLPTVASAANRKRGPGRPRKAAVSSSPIRGRGAASIGDGESVVACEGPSESPDDSIPTVAIAVNSKRGPGRPRKAVVSSPAIRGRGAANSRRGGRDVANGHVVSTDASIGDDGSNVTCDGPSESPDASTPMFACFANTKNGPGRPRKVPDASVPTVVRGANTRRVRVRGGRGGGLSKSPDASVQPPSVPSVVRGARRVRVRGGRGGGHAKLPNSPQQFNKDIPLENTAKRQRLQLGPVSKTFNTCSSIIINKFIFTLSVIQFLCSSVDYTKCGSVR